MRFNWGRLPGEVRAIGGFQRRALPARPGSSCHWVRRSPTIRRPGAGRGPVPLVFIVCLVACFRLAVIGRVSPRRATIFLVATRKMDKETPPAAAPAIADALAPPTAGGSRRNSPSRAQTSTRQFPPAAGCTRRCRRGKRCRLGFAIAGGLWCLRLGHGIRTRFVAPAQAGVQCL